MEIPIFPLGTVLFPGGRLPLRIFEPRYVEMTKACIRDKQVFGVSLIRAGYEAGTPAVPSDVGCTARIIDWEEPSPGQFTLNTQGETAFRLLSRRIQADGLIVGEVEFIEPPDPIGMPERYEKLQQLLTDLVKEIGPENFTRPPRFDDAAWVGSRLAELLPVPPERKQKLLEENDPLWMLAEVENMLRDLREDPSES
ncbi:LON peptidase substrate-binding domain-containing protein [Nevskia ramosa]|uniref:LON peptidase substrate-binding domain-containing protein n=1 Tax=Nevskia ramosa TaxID=64002 RepID=UPI0023526BB6|nr:LON peptidase substrate-binding domain-containing protein [Nevskia ramosa]